MTIEEQTRAILRQWVAEHIAHEHEERVRYQQGPAIHAARAEAHAWAALVLHQALDADGRKA